jgi:hypothetical protein
VDEKGTELTTVNLQNFNENFQKNLTVQIREIRF